MSFSNGNFVFACRLDFISFANDKRLSSNQKSASMVKKNVLTESF